MADKIVNFKFADTLEGKTVTEDDLVVINKSFAEGATSGSEKFGSTYKGTAIVGTTEADKLRIVEDITVAGGVIAASGVFENDVIPAGMSVEEIIRKLICVEKWPTTTSTKGSISASVAAPTVKANVANKAVVEYGSTVTFEAITAGAVTFSGSNSRVEGFTYGYSADLDEDHISGSKSVIASRGSEVKGATSLSAVVSGFSALTNVSGSTLGSQSVTCDKVGSNTMTVNISSETCSAKIPSIPSYYIVSNMGNLSEEHKSAAIAEVSYSIASVSNAVSFAVTAVYPVFNNISGDSLTSAVETKLPLANTQSFTVEYPSEMGIAPYASFAYPANRTLTVEIKQIDGSFKAYAGTSTDVDEANKRSINGKDVQYKVWTRTGVDKLGANTYKFTLSKSTSVA